jgi:hypothetical protein
VTIDSAWAPGDPGAIRKPVVIMALTDVAKSVDCGTCNMHMSTEGSAAAAPNQPFGMAVDANGVATNVANATDLLTQYANLICTRSNCPHKAGDTS